MTRIRKYKYEGLKAEVQKGFEQLDRGEFSKRDFDEIAEQAINLQLENRGSCEVPQPLTGDKVWPEGHIENLRNNTADETFVRHSQGEHKKSVCDVIARR